MLADLVAAGYEHETNVLMVHDGSAAKAPEHEVRAVSLEVIQPAIRRDWQAERPDFSTDILNQLTERTALYPLGATVTHLATFDGDRIASRAALYVDQETGIAQFESLVTHNDFRGRGHAGSVVSEALRRAADAGCQLVFLEADHNDWPRHWYARRGYAEVQQTHHFTRTL